MRVAGRDEIVAYANALLEVERWPEFAPPGLQVVGADEVTLLLCGVSSSRALFEHAADVGAEMVLVHHGIFWRNEPLVVDRRLRGRLEALFRANASLVAYHLALDAHETLGNAAQLAARIGATAEGPFGSFGLACTVDGLTVDELAARVADALGREPLVFARRPRADRAPRRLDRRRRLRPDPRRPRGLRRAPHGRARGAELRHRPGARHPPDRGGPPCDRAVRRAGARRASRGHVRDRVALPRDREPGLASSTVTDTRRTARPFADVLCREYSGSIMVHFGRRAR